MKSISERKVVRRRDHEASIAGSLFRIRDVLMSAYREGRGAASDPERDANTEEISPSFRARSRGCGATVSSVLVRVGSIAREEEVKERKEDIIVNVQGGILIGLLDKQQQTKGISNRKYSNTYTAWTRKKS